MGQEERETERRDTARDSGGQCRHSGARKPLGTGTAPSLRTHDLNGRTSMNLADRDEEREKSLAAEEEHV